MMRRLLARSSLWSISGAVVRNLAGVAVFVALARLLTPTEFGTVAFASVFVELIRIAVVAGVPEALIQRKAWDDAEASTAFWATMTLGAAFTILIAGIAAPIAYVYYDHTFALVLAALSMLLLIEGASTIHVAKLRRDFRYDVIAKRGMMSAVVSGVLGVALAYAGWGVWALVISRLVAVASASAVLWGSSNFRPAFAASWGHVKALAGFSTAMFLGQFLGQLSRSIASVVIGSVIGPAAVGQYQIGSRALDLLNSVVIQPIQGVALSAFSEVQRQNGSLWKAYLRMTRLTAVVACPAHLGLAAVAPDFVHLVFGPQWDQAIWILMTLALGVGPLSLNLFQGAILAAAGRPDLNLKAMVLSTIAIAVTAVATVWFGVVGVAIGLTVRLYLTTPVNLRFVARGLGTSAWEPVRNVLPVFACALVMAAVVAALRLSLADQEPILRLAACVAGGCIVYPLLLLVFARPALADAIDSVTPMLPRRLGRILRLR